MPNLDPANGSAEARADAAASFDPLRRTLIRVAYRMLGSVADAEDMVQEAFIRWMDVDRTEVRVPEAFLRRMVMRMCLDQLKSARHQRETYVGPWLPEPVVEEDEQEDVTLPLLLALERLSPLERAAFLLHDVFGLEFDEVATTIQRDPAACRQLAARLHACARGAAALPCREAARDRIGGGVFAASRSGDMRALGAMLAEDVSLHADGGGKRPAAGIPVLGFERVMKVHEYLQAVRHACVEARACGVHQRAAGFRYAGSGRRAADHGARDRGRENRRDLCRAES